MQMLYYYILDMNPNYFMVSLGKLIEFLNIHEFLGMYPKLHLFNFHCYSYLQYLKDVLPPKTPNNEVFQLGIFSFKCSILAEHKVFVFACLCPQILSRLFSGC